MDALEKKFEWHIINLCRSIDSYITDTEFQFYIDVTLIQSLQGIGALEVLTKNNRWWDQ